MTRIEELLGIAQEINAENESINQLNQQVEPALRMIEQAVYESIAGSKQHDSLRVKCEYSEDFIKEKEAIAGHIEITVTIEGCRVTLQKMLVIDRAEPGSAQKVSNDKELFNFELAENTLKLLTRSDSPIYNDIYQEIKNKMTSKKV